MRGELAEVHGKLDNAARRRVQLCAMVKTILTPKGVIEHGVPVTENTLRHWRYLTSAGKPTGPRYYKIGSKVVYDLAAVDEWLDEQRQQGGARSA